MKNTKFIFVTGGVVSGLGKGITAASIAKLMSQKGHTVSMQKLDPYVNFDTGLMHPNEHGETFVTFDGGETDLDLGHYERFINRNLTKTSSVTTGKIYKTVIENERKGLYQGKTVQVIPHITNEIKKQVLQLVKDNNAQINIIEIGGTAGDMESLPFIESIRQLRNDLGQSNTLFLHCTLVPFLKASQEHKSKPTQQSVATLRALGIQPDIIVTRSEHKISQEIKDKIAMFCNIDKSSVIEAIDNDIIYDVVNKLADQNIDKAILKQFKLKTKKRKTEEWDSLIAKVKTSQKEIKVALVGKYKMIDAYLSVIEALKHAGYVNKRKVIIDYISAERLTVANIKSKLKGYDTIVVPGGFGERGTKGKILSIEYARINKIPFLGICYGMQLAIVEFARNVLGLKGANSTEINPKTQYPIIDLITGKTKDKKSGTLRLGDFVADVVKNTKTMKLYKSSTITERHRHKYEFTKEVYDKYFKGSELKVSALHVKGKLIEIIELSKHPFFIGTQFHGELRSRPTNPHPLFVGLIKAVK